MGAARELALTAIGTRARTVAKIDPDFLALFFWQNILLVL